MARARFIRPEFFTDEKISELCFGARLLFIGSWNLADLNGVLEWRPRQLKALVFPYDDIPILQIDKWMNKMEELGLVEKYTIGAATYGRVVNFGKHQSFTESEIKAGSRHPLPEGACSDSFRKRGGYSRSTNRSTEGALIGARAGAALSPALTLSPAPEYIPRARDEMDILKPEEPEISDSERWRLEKLSPWAKELIKAGCKIGGNNWTAWQGLVEAYGIKDVLSKARGIPAEERWPDRVESALIASRGQQNPGDAINPARLHQMDLSE